jgi:hypothetical protein
MKHHNKNKKDNVIESAILFTLATILVIAGAATAITITTLKSADATIFEYIRSGSQTTRSAQALCCIW